MNVILVSIGMVVMIAFLAVVIKYYFYTYTFYDFDLKDKVAYKLLTIVYKNRSIGFRKEKYISKDGEDWIYISDKEGPIDVDDETKEFIKKLIPKSNIIFD